MYVLVKVAVVGADELPLAGNKREGLTTVGIYHTDTGVLAGFCQAAVHTKAGIVYFTGRLPLQEHLAVAGGGGEADQRDDGVCGHGCQVEEQEEEQQRPNVRCGM